MQVQFHDRRGVPWQPIIGVVLTGLLATLATIQYRWLGEVSEAERARMRDGLRTRASEFTQAFDRELTRLDTGHVKEVLNEAVHSTRGVFDHLGRCPLPSLGALPIRSEDSRFHEDQRQGISEIVSHDSEHLISQLDGSLCRAIETGAVDRERRPLSELARHAQVVRPVQVGWCRGQKGDCAQAFSRRDEGDDGPRADQE